MKSPLLHAILAGAVCVTLITSYGVWYAIVEAKSIAVAHMENQISTKTETANRIASARASLAEISGDEDSLRNYFVPETGVVAFINNLEAQGKTLGATVRVLSVSTSGASTQSSLAFTLTIRGTFDAVMRTVGAIEYAPYNLSISKLSLGQDDKNSWHATLDLLVGSVSASASRASP